ncbi:hypothetical protein LCGC14_2931740, partial [marine sediment metagenome]
MKPSNYRERAQSGPSIPTSPLTRHGSRGEPTRASARVASQGSDFRLPTFFRGPRSKIVRRVLLPVLALLLIASPAYGQISISGVTPDSGWGVEPPLSGVQEFTINGSFPFPGGMTVALSRSGQPDIAGSGVTWVSPTSIKCTLTLASAAPGRWDVQVTHNVLGSALLADGFTVKGAPKIRRIADWGGPVAAMEVVGNTGYVARGAGMVILDLTDPAKMVELG